MTDTMSAGVTVAIGGLGAPPVRAEGLADPGCGPARAVYAALLGEGYDAALSEAAVYGIAEGYARAAGSPDGSPLRFHQGVSRGVGDPLPAGLDAESLSDRARDAMDDPRLFSGLTFGDACAVALVVGADLHRDLARAPGF